MPLHNNIAYKKKKAFFDIKKHIKTKDIQEGSLDRNGAAMECSN